MGLWSGSVFEVRLGCCGPTHCYDASPLCCPFSLLGQTYQYTEDLLSLEQVGGAPLLPGRSVEGVLPVEVWNLFLSSHPDQQFAAFLRRGIAAGFRIGYDRSHALCQASGNFPSVSRHSEAAAKYIEGEAEAERLFLASQPGDAHCNPVGLIPKCHQPGKFRLIVDLSAPLNRSVNDGIDSGLCSLSYASVDDAVRLVCEAGQGAFMAKLDLEAAYRHVPVHPDDQGLLAVKWGDEVYVDSALPFGLHSAPKIFTAVADGIAWCMSCSGIKDFIHYLDDFLFVGPPGSSDCLRALEAAIPLCKSLGFPVAPHKVEGPSTSITFLGIEVDSCRFELRLPAEKLSRLRRVLREWGSRRSATKRRLQSLIGLLSHAATVVRQGRTFLRGLIEAMKRPRRLDQRTRLDLLCRADIVWWGTFVQQWNGVSFFQSDCPLIDTVCSDASGSWGCGAYTQSGSPAWLQTRWPPTWVEVSIAVKELLPIVLAAAVWGRRWSHGRVLFRSDNQAVVAALFHGRLGMVP